jgi:hypothetical protein
MKIYGPLSYQVLTTLFSSVGRLVPGCRPPQSGAPRTPPSTPRKAPYRRPGWAWSQRSRALRCACDTTRESGGERTFWVWEESAHVSSCLRLAKPRKKVFVRGTTNGSRRDEVTSDTQHDRVRASRGLGSDCFAALHFGRPWARGDADGTRLLDVRRRGADAFTAGRESCLAAQVAAIFA